MKSEGCMNPKNSLMSATDLFLQNWRGKFAYTFLILGVFALSFLFSIQASAQTLEAFDPNVTGIVVYQTVIQPDGKIVIGGAFNTVGGTARTNIARLNADGSLDTSFAALALDNTVFSVALQPDGKVVIGGFFTTAGGQPRQGIARLNADGSLDATFDPKPNGGLNAAVIQPDGKILIGGSFTTVSSQPRSRIARLNPDGSLDTAFNPNAGGTSFPSVSGIIVLPDGKILLQGGFGAVGGVPYARLARINADGTVDESFNDPQIDSSISTFALQPDGKIIITGGFANVGGQPRSRIARLNNNGTLDPTLNLTFVATAPLSPLLLSLGIQSDGKILVSGSFSSVNGQAVNSVVRLNADGTVDASFAAPPFSAFSSVNGIMLQPDGKLLLAGSFSTVNGLTRNRLARLTNTAPAESTVSVTPTSILWTRGGTAPDFSRVTFERSSDGGVTYAFLGNASRIGTSPNWILRGLSLPTGQNFIRVRGFYQSGNINNAGSIIESISNLTLNARTRFDFDGDGKADISVFRPADRTWWISPSAAIVGSSTAVQWGLSSDKLTPADFDGDGKTDITVWRDGTWYILQSSNNSLRTATLGTTADIPLPADFDGDGRADLAVFRPSNGTWLTLSLTTNISRSIQWGLGTDVPIAADFNGDGRADYAVFRDGFWYIALNGGGVQGFLWGIAGDKLVPADYDGDGSTDVGVFRGGTWYIRGSQAGQQIFIWGIAGDIPAPADYDGDGKADFAVFRNGTWYLQRSTAGSQVTSFGITNDKPLPAVFNP